MVGRFDTELTVHRLLGQPSRSRVPGLMAVDVKEGVRVCLEGGVVKVLLLLTPGVVLGGSGDDKLLCGKANGECVDVRLPSSWSLRLELVDEAVLGDEAPMLWCCPLELEENGDEILVRDEVGEGSWLLLIAVDEIEAEEDPRLLRGSTSNAEGKLSCDALSAASPGSSTGVLTESRVLGN